MHRVPLCCFASRFHRNGKSCALRAVWSHRLNCLLLEQTKMHQPGDSDELTHLERTNRWKSDISSKKRKTIWDGKHHSSWPTHMGMFVCAVVVVYRGTRNDPEHRPVLSAHPYILDAFAEKWLLLWQPFENIIWAMSWFPFIIVMRRSGCGLILQTTWF